MGAKIFIMALALVIAACSMRHIDVSSVELISPSQLASSLPKGFEETEGTKGKLIGVSLTVTGRSLEVYGDKDRNAAIKYIDCYKKTVIEYSFGPFVEGQYISEYLRSRDIDSYKEYKIVGTISLKTAQQGTICAVLESRSYTGVMASSSPIRIPKI